ncbi:hypothetical protein BLNAU_14631 [Blattamonas nauphoetae]|uniref:Uncharacterized protein n=1 Tax=Blattamonas nauphoetae TaxID=2049346 RepID=A0ABQ9XG41_9EUKA|nr:hypothetical protein BLNAU_14631 [Blattamonas nauphoetae]
MTFFILVLSFPTIFATHFPRCHSVIQEDVWKRKVFACTVKPPPRNSTETFTRFKLSFYVQSQRKYFKDRFKYQVFYGPGVEGLTDNRVWKTHPPYVNEWFTCSRKEVPYDQSDPDSMKIETAYCAVDVFVDNANLFFDAKLGMMFHVDNESISYDLPPKELLEPRKPTPDDRYRRPSPGAQAFKLIGQVLLLIIIISGLVFGIGIYITRSCSKLWMDPREYRQRNMSEKEKILSSLRKGERIREKQKEIQESGGSLDPLNSADDLLLSSSSDSETSLDDIPSPDLDRRTRPLLSSGLRFGQDSTVEDDVAQLERELERQFELRRAREAERENLLWSVRAGARVRPKATNRRNPRAYAQQNDRNEESPSVNTNSSTDSDDDLNPLLPQANLHEVLRRRR